MRVASLGNVRRTSSVHFSNVITEVVVGENSVVSHYQIERESTEAFHVSTLRDDAYSFDPEAGEWRGLVRKTRFALGDRVRVRVRRTDPDRGEIDLAFL